MTSDSTNHQPIVSAASRRARYTLSTSVLALAVTASCVLAIVLGHRFHLRIDMTAMREHSLAPRTSRILTRLEGEHRIIVSVDNTMIDREARQRLEDLLDAFKRESPVIRVQWINASQPGAIALYQQLIDDLARRHSVEISTQRETLEDIADRLRSIVSGTGTVSTAILRLHQALVPENESNLEEQAALVRNLGARLEPAVGALRQSAGTMLAGVLLPAVDEAQVAAEAPLRDVSTAMDAVSRFSDEVAEDQSASSDVADAARELALLAGRWRDDAARALDDLSRLEPTDALIVGRILAASDAVLVNSARGTLAIDLESILPPSAADPAQVESQPVVFGGEQLITTALGALSNSRPPILAFVHAQHGTLLDDRGAPTGAARLVFGRIVDHARMTQADLLEWPVAREALRPDPSSIDPSGERPVVWIVLGAPSPAGIDPRQPGTAAERNVRVEKLGNAVQTLVDAGENLLISVEPSDLPALGERDPVDRALEPFGVRLDSGRPLLMAESSPSGRLTWTHMVLRDYDERHPIGRAVSGLALALPWATPIDLVPPVSDGARNGPLARVPRDLGAWGESQWLAIRGAAARGGQPAFQPLLLSSAPAPDPQRDAVEPPEGGWIVGAWASRPFAGEEQRIVVVCSSSWMTDLAMRATARVGQRSTVRFPGNSELFDAGVSWLAHLDDLIAPGPDVRDVPRIRRMDRGPLSVLRWSVVLAPPLLVLIVGGLLHLRRD